MPESYQPPPPDQEQSAHYCAILASARSWFVIPTHNELKKPRHVGWQRDASRDPATINRWAEKYPGTNFGIETGKKSGICVLDLDGPDAVQWWNDQQQQHGTIVTPTVSTARGFHLYFSCSRAEACASRKGVLPGVDVSGDGRWVMCAGNIHPDGATRYRWTVPINVGLSPVPEFLRAIILRTPPVTEWKSLCDKETLSVTDGRRERVSAAGVPDALNVAVCNAIRRTLPTEPGTRHRRLFDFVRALKAIEPIAAMDPHKLVPLANAWHAEALPFIRTKDFRVTAAEFMSAWKACIFGEATSVVALLATSKPIPESANARVEPRAALGELLASMQSAAGEGVPIFLSCRKAAEVLSTRFGVALSYRSTSRMIASFRHEGLVKEIVPSTLTKSPRILWLGTLPAR